MNNCKRNILHGIGIVAVIVLTAGCTTYNPMVIRDNNSTDTGAGNVKTKYEDAKTTNQTNETDSADRNLKRRPTE